jgi:hypothetical protein
MLLRSLVIVTLAFAYAANVEATEPAYDPAAKDFVRCSVYLFALAETEDPNSNGQLRNADSSLSTGYLFRAYAAILTSWEQVEAQTSALTARLNLPSATAANLVSALKGDLPSCDELKTRYAAEIADAHKKLDSLKRRGQ